MAYGLLILGGELVGWQEDLLEGSYLQTVLLMLSELMTMVL